jgi:uncharacterized protein (TIGR03067 family)
MIWAVCTVLGLGFATPADEAAAKQELAKLEGTWRVVQVEENGMKFPEDAIRAAEGSVTVKGDQHTLRHGGQDRGTVTVKVDPTAKPKHYDLIIPKDAPGPDAGKTLRGIYELDGDNWKLCIDKTGAGRPTDFTAAAGSGRSLVIMKRDKAGNAKK